ncbi:aspC [Wigglesworthia glossinidia endosymbiont of Glossina brevipalpis]|uniref:Aminotransferase n=1 Tax=Wigglesworthia glossinidia brevipalpis TaxID=36870 RepID=Q8D377_WIGBR|nr:aspC [Wigglesworthia glossinidia endosymbiont of Glossina brevipalpis]
MFELTELSPLDPVLGMIDIIKNDKRDGLINLGIGVYKDIKGNTPILDSVKKAENILIESEKTKNYLNIEGLESFIQHSKSLIFGKENLSELNDFIASVQCPGGTSALKIAAEFLIRHTKIRKIWISDPSWPNHEKLFSFAGFKVHKYPYFNKEKNQLDFYNMKKCLENIKDDSAVIFHSSCHNPTGIDPSFEQWLELAKISRNKKWIPIFDSAYQGFSNGLKDDVFGIKIFLKYINEFVVCNSFSKNFSLYNERVGTCNFITKNKKHASNVFSQLRSIIRVNYSNPPAHGANIINVIFSKKDLFNLWKSELNEMRNRIKQIRSLFADTLFKINNKKNFNFIKNQHGMFSFIGLNRKNVMDLRNNFRIYVIDSGRLNFAAITNKNIYEVCRSINCVLNN